MLGSTQVADETRNGRHIGLRKPCSSHTILGPWLAGVVLSDSAVWYEERFYFGGEYTLKSDLRLFSSVKVERKKKKNAGTILLAVENAPSKCIPCCLTKREVDQSLKSALINSSLILS